MTVDFTHDTSAQRVTIRSGGAAESIVDELHRLDASAVMTISAPRTRGVLEALAGRTRLAWDEIVQHVPSDLADRATAAASDASVDAIVAVGGGSAIGLAKAIALTLDVPIIAVPTTYAGSEATNVWGVTDDTGKRTGADARVLPRTVVYDPVLVRTMPVELAVASGLNAVAHCVDSMWAPRPDPINSALAVEALTALRRGLIGLRTRPGDLAASAQTQYGCYLAGVAFASAGSGMHHKICHVLGGSFGLPHAATHAIVLPYVLAFNEPVARDAAHRLACAFDAPTATEGLAQLRARLEAPVALRDVGFHEDDIGRAVRTALPAIPPSNPRRVDEQSLTRLLRAAWAGDTPVIVADERTT